MDSTRAHMLLSGAVAVLLGLLLFVVFRLDHSFGAGVGVTPAPFESAIEAFDAIDKT